MECCKKSDIFVNENDQNACSWSYAKREGQQLSCKKGNYVMMGMCGSNGSPKCQLPENEVDPDDPDAVTSSYYGVYCCAF